MDYETNKFSVAYILEPYKSSFNFEFDEEDESVENSGSKHFIVAAFLNPNSPKKESLLIRYSLEEADYFNPADAGLLEDECTPCVILNQIAERDWETDPLVAQMIGWFITQEEDYAMCPDSHLWTFEVYKSPNEKIIEYFDKTEVDELQAI